MEPQDLLSIASCHRGSFLGRSRGSHEKVLSADGLRIQPTSHAESRKLDTLQTVSQAAMRQFTATHLGCALR